MTEQTDVEYRPAPGWPKVVGILSLIFGILAITCGLGGVGMLIASDQLLGGMMGSQLPEGTPPPPMAPPLDAVMIASTVVSLFVNGVLIVAGASLLRRRASGRSLHLVYALIAVVSAFIGTYAGYNGQQQQAQALEVWLEDHGDTELGQAIAQQQAQQAGMQQTFQYAGLAFGLGLTLAWPVFCIIWFGMVKRDHESMLGAEDEFV